MEKIRVMHVIDGLRIGGAEKVVTTIAELMDKKRFEVSICYFNDGELVAETKNKGINLHKIHFTKVLLPLFLLRLARLMRQQKIDIVHTHLFSADVLGRIAARLAGVKTVFCTLHTSYVYKTKTGIANRLKLLLDSTTGNLFCDKFIAVSSEVKDYHIINQRINGKKTCILENPVVIKKYSPLLTFNSKQKKMELGLKPDARAILNVANITEIKGQQYLITAMTQIVKNFPNAVLLIAGDGPLRSMLSLKCNELGLNGHVYLLGRRNDVAELLAMSDIFVLSSLNEGVSIALLEAMAMKKPIVATNVGSNPDVLEDGNHGILIPSMDPEALERAIIDLLKNRDKAERLAISAQRAAMERFDSRVIMAEMEALYINSV